jgi:hypothetical protein
MTIATSYENVSYNSPDGAVFGASTTEKIAFYGVTPIVQPSAAAQVTLTTFSPMQTSPFGWSTSAEMLTTLAAIIEIQNVLRNLGLMKGSS